jgi:hypothetical protein
MDPRGLNETVLTVGLLALGVYFFAFLVRGVLIYLRFRRLRPTAIVTWDAPRPPHLRALVAIGVVSALVTLLNTYMGRPLHHVLPQCLMSLYFLLMVPVLAGIPLGLYRDGVWADAGFLAWQKIGRMAFREAPEIVLVLLPRSGSRSFRLPVPRAEYGTVRKTLDEKARAHILNVEEGMLGL